MKASSYAHGASSLPLLGETIGENLRRTVDQHGDREALVVRQQGFRASYREFWELTTKCARGLLARGVKKGDRVGIWAPNRYEWTVVQYATARMGAILVNINPAYKTSELEYALNQSGVSFLVLAKAFRTNDYVAMLEEVRGRCPELRESVVLEDGWEKLLRDSTKVAEADLDELEATLQFDDPINIQYTSGTTGFPKGATLSHHGILNNGYFIGEALRYTEADRVCIPVPFYHCFGMVLGNLACTTHGSVMVIPGEAYDPETGAVVPRGERGELCTRGYNVMLGYWNNEDATSAAIDAGRWMHTGDLATMDEDGYLNIVGRIKDMIIRGGENVYPREIEEFLYTHPKVRDVQVIGVPDAKYGEEIMAYIQLQPGEQATTEEIREDRKSVV